MKGLPASIRRAALYVSSRAASICVATWAIWCCIPCDSSNDNSTEHTVRNQSHMAQCHREMKSISKLYLEVKDAFSKLAPLSGVRDCVVKAALRKAKHLKATGTSHHTWRHCCLERRTASINSKETCRVLPEQRFQSCPRSAFQWHTCTRDRPGPRCSSLVPEDSTNLIVHPCLARIYCECFLVLK